MNETNQTKRPGPHMTLAPMAKSVETAMAIAIDAHQGQRERKGAPYIMHPLRVMMAVDNDQARAAAILHDVVEDTTVSLDDLRRSGIPEDVVDAVDALTKRPGEAYALYLARVESNPIARIVKTHDLLDNLRLDRLDKITDKDLARIEKYRNALKRLTQVDGDASIA